MTAMMDSILERCLQDRRTAMERADRAEIALIQASYVVEAARLVRRIHNNADSKYRIHQDGSLEALFAALDKLEP